MRYNHTQAEKAMKRKHKKERPLLMEYGALPEAIDKFFEEDDETRCGDRSFYDNTLSFSDRDEATLESPYSADSSLGIFDQIEDPRLVAGFAALNPTDREIVVLHLLGGFSLEQISTYFGKSYAMIEQRYYRAKQKIKKLP